MSDPRDPIAALAAYWSSLADGRAPERARFAPEAIPSLLSMLLLSEFETDPFRVRYRLTGTRVDQWNGIKIIGRYLDEMASDETAAAIGKLAASYRQCHDSAAPVISDYDWPGRHGGILKIRFGMFPLLLNGAVRQCIAIEDYSALPHRYDSVPLR